MIIGAGQDTARPAPKKILDACCGKKMMWFDKHDDRVLFADIRRESHSIQPNRGWPNGTTFIIAPDILQDFADMKFPDETFYHVVFDPPHCHASEGRKKGLNAKSYGLLFTGWREILRHGFSECFRILKPNGTLIFKWCEVEIPLREVLELTPEKPLYGHRSGKKAQTHWVCFMKQESPVLGEESPAQNTIEICHTAPNSQSTQCGWCGHQLEANFRCVNSACAESD